MRSVTRTPGQGKSRSHKRPPFAVIGLDGCAKPRSSAPLRVRTCLDRTLQNISLRIVGSNHSRVTRAAGRKAATTTFNKKRAPCMISSMGKA